MCIKRDYIFMLHPRNRLKYRVRKNIFRVNGTKHQVCLDILVSNETKQK